jgi:RNA polymerase sigma-70 factor (ECF subfamily)
VTVSRFRHDRVSTSMDRQIELQLVGRLRNGDPDAFDAVHRAFNARLFNFLARLSNRRDVAEDLLEETWLRLVRHARQLEPDTRLGPWLFTVARHLHASYRRARLVEESHAEGLIGLWPCGSPEPSPLESAEASETQRRISMALASLPVTYREALLLIVVEGLRPAEAAEVCGVAAEAMRQRLSRARALLQRRLTDAERAGLASLNEVPT